MLKKVLFFTVFLLIGIGIYILYEHPTRNFHVYDKKHLWGEEVKGMFPVINTPQYETEKSKVSWLKDDDEVLIWDYKNTTYIYPLFILGYHHILNDTIDHDPVAITTCLLSGSSAVYNRRVGWRTLNFDVLGPLFYGNLVMYDKETDTHWLQLTGESIAGPLTGKRLQFVGYLQTKKWKDIAQQKHIKVLKPIKDIVFYRNFAKKYKTNPLGLKSLTPYKTPDVRLSPYEIGIGVVSENGARFYKGSDVIIANKQKEVITRVYWYTWSAFFPSTAIK